LGAGLAALGGAAALGAAALMRRRKNNKDISDKFTPKSGQSKFI